MRHCDSIYLKEQEKPNKAQHRTAIPLCPIAVGELIRCTCCQKNRKHEVKAMG